MKQRMNFVTIIVVTLLLIAAVIYLVSHKNDVRLTVVNSEKELPVNIAKWITEFVHSNQIQLFYEKQGEKEYQYWLYVKKGQASPANLYETYKINAVVKKDRLKVYIEDASTRNDEEAKKTIIAHCNQAIPPEHVEVYYNNKRQNIIIKSI